MTDQAAGKESVQNYHDNPNQLKFWVKGKNKEGKDRRWGPFKDMNEAQKFKASRSDIRNAIVKREY